MLVIFLTARFLQIIIYNGIHHLFLHYTDGMSFNFLLFGAIFQFLSEAEIG